MSTNVFSIKDYYLFTFISTSHALKGEKVLKEYGADFVMIPTLREISSSCGLSIKIAPENLEEYYQELKNNYVAVEELFQVQKQDGKNIISKIKAGGEQPPA